MSMIGPPSSWTDAFATAKSTHTELIDKSSTWANYLKTKLDTIATEITEPDVTVSWGTITGSVPLGWGAAFTTPTAPTSTTQTGSAVAAVGADGTFDALVEDTVPVWSASLPANPGDLQSLDFGTAPVLIEATLDVFAPDVPTLTVSSVAAMSSVAMPTAPELPEQPAEPNLSPIVAPEIAAVVVPTVVTTLPDVIDDSITEMTLAELPSAPALSVAPVAPVLGSVDIPGAVEITAPTVVTTLPDVVDTGVAEMTLATLPSAPELMSSPTTPVLGAVEVPGAVEITAPTVVTTLPEDPDVSVSAIAETTMPTLTFTAPDAPDAPVVSGLVVNELSPISLPEFSSTEVDDLAELIASFSYTPDTYSPTLKSSVVTAVESVLGGSPVIGESAFQDIFTAAADDLTAIYTGDVMQAGNVCGMFGELPSEALLSRVDIATTKHRQELQKVRISTAIEQAKTWRDDFWKGIDAAQAFEQLWSTFFTAEEGRRLQAASAAVEAEIAIYNTKVARFNAVLARVQADIAVAAEHRQRALLTIEEHKERLAHKEANLRESDRLLALYQAQWQGVQIETSSTLAVTAEQRQLALATLEDKRARHTADIEETQQRISAYQAQVQAAATRTAMTAEERAGQALVLDAYRAKLTGAEIALKLTERDIALFQAEIQAYQATAGAQTSLFSSQVQALGVDVDQRKAVHAADVAALQQKIAAYQAQVQAASTRTAISAEERAGQALLLDDYRAKLSGAELALKLTERDIALFQAEVQSYQAVAGAQTALFGNQVQLTNTDIEQRKAAHAASIAALQQKIAAYQAQVQAATARTAMTSEERAGQALLLDAYRAQLAGLEIELKATERDITLFQAKTQAYQATAGAQTSLFSSQVQATGTDVEQQKAIHAAAIAEYQAAVQAYQAQVQALAAQTSVAAEQRERSLVGLQEYRARVEGRRGDIEAADTQVKAWLGQWDGYAKAANAETTIFAEQVRAFSAGLEQRKAKLSGDADRARTLIERETAITQRFSAEWQAIAQKAQATLASMQTSAIPAEISIKSEEGRQRGEAQVLQLALANAQNELTKGVETAKLRLQQVQYAAQQGVEVQKTIATLMAHTMGSYLSAGSISYGASASSSYDNSNSYSMTHPE